MDDKNGLIKLRKADVISSIVLFIFGFLFLIGALRMPFKIYAKTTGNPSGIYCSPGILPTVIGSVIIILAIMLFIAGIKGGGRITLSGLKSPLDYVRTKKFLRLVIATGLLVIYIFVLIGRVRFDLSTFIYIFSNMLIFRAERYSVIKILIICAAFSLAVTYSFYYLAKIPLP